MLSSKQFQCWCDWSPLSKEDHHTLHFGGAVDIYIKEVLFCFQSEFSGLLPLKSRGRLAHDLLDAFVTNAALVHDIMMTQTAGHKMAALALVTVVFSRLSKKTLGQLLRDGVEHVMGFSWHTDTILN